MLHACIAIDGTAGKSYSGLGNRARFVRMIEEHLWLVEPMLAMGINLDTTDFRVMVGADKATRFSTFLYEIFRCHLAHGEEIPPGYTIKKRESDHYRDGTLGISQLDVPDTIIFALLAVVVFSPVNASQRIEGNYWLTYAETRFVINDWWGRMVDAKEYFSGIEYVRVTINWPAEKLDNPA